MYTYLEAVGDEQSADTNHNLHSLKFQDLGHWKELVQVPEQVQVQVQVQVLELVLVLDLVVQCSVQVQELVPELDQG
jgi:hypothetical protein